MKNKKIDSFFLMCQNYPPYLDIVMFIKNMEFKKVLYIH